MTNLNKQIPLSNYFRLQKVISLWLILVIIFSLLPSPVLIMAQNETNKEGNDDNALSQENSSELPNIDNKIKQKEKNKNIDPVNDKNDPKDPKDPLSEEIKEEVIVDGSDKIMIPVTEIDEEKKNKEKFDEKKMKKMEVIGLKLKSANLNEDEKKQLLEKITKIKNKDSKNEQLINDFKQQKKQLLEDLDKNIKAKIKRQELKTNKKELKNSIKKLFTGNNDDDSDEEAVETEKIKNNFKKQKKQLEEINALLKKELDENLSSEFSAEEKQAIEYIEPNYLFEIQETGEIWNDPKLSEQWGVKMVSSNNFVSSENIENKPIVAIIDTGIDYNHEDLAGQFWTSETCVDDINEAIDGGCPQGGYDFVDNDNDPFPIDNANHGTQVTGIIAANTNNAKGIASISHNKVQIMALRASDNGLLELDDINRAIYFAVNNGAKVINMSFGGGTYSESLKNAIAYAEQNEVLVVTAAGNYSSNNDIEPMYPANYELNNIVSVASININEDLSSFSNYGANSVDIVAPGENILTTDPNNIYKTLSGTSFSAPFVSAVAGVYLAEGNTGYVTLKDKLVENASVNEKLLTKINNGQSLRLSKNVTPPIVLDPNKLYLKNNQENYIYENGLSTPGNYVLTWGLNGQTKIVVKHENVQTIIETTLNNGEKEFSFSITETGNYSIEVAITDDSNKITNFVRNIRITIPDDISKINENKYAEDTNPNNLIGINGFSNTWNAYLDYKYGIDSNAFEKALQEGKMNEDGSVEYEYNLITATELQSLEEKQTLKLQQIERAATLFDNDLMAYYEAGNTIGYEDEIGRKDNISLFTLADDRQVAILHTQNTFFTDENGIYREIQGGIKKVSDSIIIDDNLISSPEDGHAMLFPSDAPLNINFYDYAYLTSPVKALWNTSDQKNSYTLTVINDDSWLHWQPSRTFILDVNNELIKENVFKKVEPLLFEDSIVFSNIAENIDDEFETIRDGIKHKVILKEKPEGLLDGGNYVVETILQIPEGVQVKVEENIQNDDFETDKPVVLTKNGVEVFKIPNFIVYDAADNYYNETFDLENTVNDDTSNENVPELDEEIIDDTPIIEKFPMTKWEKTDNGYKIVVLIPSDWLLVEQRQYPVIIDPNTEGLFLQETYQNNVCAYGMKGASEIEEFSSSLGYVGKYSSAVVMPAFGMDFSNFKSNYLKTGTIDSAYFKVKQKGSVLDGNKRNVKVYEIKEKVSCDDEKSYSRLNRGTSAIGSDYWDKITGGSVLHSYDIKSVINNSSFYGVYLHGVSFNTSEKKYFINTGSDNAYYYISYTPPKLNEAPNKPTVYCPVGAQSKSSPVNLATKATDPNPDDYLMYNLALEGKWDNYTQYNQRLKQGTRYDITYTYGGRANRFTDRKTNFYARARDDNKISSPESDVCFVELSNKNPSAPIILSPVNNSEYGIENSIESLNITWNSATDPDGDKIKYTLYFASSYSAISTYPVFNNYDSCTEQISTSCPFSVEVNKHYYFQVAALDDDNGAARSAYTHVYIKNIKAPKNFSISPSNLSLGQNVNFTITGGNLDLVNSVTISGISGSFSPINKSSTQLTLPNVSIPKTWSSGSRSLNFTFKYEAGTVQYSQNFQIKEQVVYRNFSISNISRTYFIQGIPYDFYIYGNNFYTSDNATSNITTINVGNKSAYNFEVINNTQIKVNDFIFDAGGNTVIKLANESYSNSINSLITLSTNSSNSNYADITPVDLFIKSSNSANSKNYREGDSLTVNFKVHNLGNVTANNTKAEVQICEYVSCTGNNKIFIKSFTDIGNIASNRQSASYQAILSPSSYPTWLKPSNLHSAYIVVKVFSDSSEQNEINNISFNPIIKSSSPDANTNIECNGYIISGLKLQDASVKKNEAFVDLMADVRTFYTAINDKTLKYEDIQNNVTILKNRLIQWQNERQNSANSSQITTSVNAIIANLDKLKSIEFVQESPITEVLPTEGASSLQAESENNNENIYQNLLASELFKVQNGENATLSLQSYQSSLQNFLPADYNKNTVPYYMLSDYSTMSFTEDDWLNTVKMNELHQSDDIKFLAGQLEYNPLKILNYLQEKIAFSPYLGTMQGAKGCLTSEKCNDTDLAHLTVALMRASEIPARYRRQKVKFLRTNFEALLGIKDVNDLQADYKKALNITDKNVEMTVLMAEVYLPVYGEGINLASARIEGISELNDAVSVKAKIAENLLPREWFPVFPIDKVLSYKTNNNFIGADQIVDNSIMKFFARTDKITPKEVLYSVINKTDGTDPITSELKAPNFQTMPLGVPADLLGTAEISADYNTELPVVSVSIKRNNSEVFSFSKNTLALDDFNFRLSYNGATEADNQAMISAGSMFLLDPSNKPISELKLVPILTAGNASFIGNIPLNVYDELTIEVKVSKSNQTLLSHELKTHAGAETGMAFKLQNELQVDNVHISEGLGKVAETYLHKLNNERQSIAGLFHQKYQALVGLAIVSTNLVATFNSGVLQSLDVAGYEIGGALAGHNYKIAGEVLSSSQQNNLQDLLELSEYYLQESVLEKLSAMEVVSAIRVLKRAYTQGNEVEHYTNIADRHYDNDNLPLQIKEAIDALLQGGQVNTYEVYVTKKPVQIDNDNFVAYLAINTNTREFSPFLVKVDNSNNLQSLNLMTIAYGPQLQNTGSICEMQGINDTICKFVNDTTNYVDKFARKSNYNNEEYGIYVNNCLPTGTIGPVSIQNLGKVNKTDINNYVAYHTTNGVCHVAGVPLRNKYKYKFGDTPYAFWEWSNGAKFYENANYTGNNLIVSKKEIADKMYDYYKTPYNGAKREDFNNLYTSMRLGTFIWNKGEYTEYFIPKYTEPSYITHIGGWQWQLVNRKREIVLSKKSINPYINCGDDANCEFDQERIIDFLGLPKTKDFNSCNFGTRICRDFMGGTIHHADDLLPGIVSYVPLKMQQFIDAPTRDSGYPVGDPYTIASNNNIIKQSFINDKSLKMDLTTGLVWEDRDETFSCDKPSNSDENTGEAMVVYAFFAGIVATVGGDITDFMAMIFEPHETYEGIKQMIGNPRGTLGSVVDSMGTFKDELLDYNTCEVRRAYLTGTVFVRVIEVGSVGAGVARGSSKIVKKVVNEGVSASLKTALVTIKNYTALSEGFRAGVHKLITTDSVDTWFFKQILESNEFLNIVLNTAFKLEKKYGAMATTKMVAEAKELNSKIMAKQNSFFNMLEKDIYEDILKNRMVANTLYDFNLTEVKNNRDLVEYFLTNHIEVNRTKHLQELKDIIKISKTNPNAPTLYNELISEPVFYEDIVEKMTTKGSSHVYELKDLERYRIVVPELQDIEKVFSNLQAKYGNGLVEIKQKYKHDVTNKDGKIKVNESLQLIIKDGEDIFELQVKTERSHLMGEIEHEGVYKAKQNDLDITPEQKEELSRLYLEAYLEDMNNYLQYLNTK